MGPILEGIRYEIEGTPIDEMFLEPLSRSMDSERLNEAHPSFPILIRQLSSDEARILISLRDGEFDYVHTLAYDAHAGLFRGQQ